MRIFVSYSRIDRALARDLVRRLRDRFRHAEVWYADSLSNGYGGWAETLRQIAACDIFICLLSQDAVESPYCQAELEEALQQGKCILPVVIRAGTPVPASLRQYPLVDLSRPNVLGGITADGLADLRGAIARILAARAGSPPGRGPVSPGAAPAPVRARRQGGGGRGRLWALGMALLALVALIALVAALHDRSDREATPTVTLVAVIPDIRPSPPPETATAAPTATQPLTPGPTAKSSTPVETRATATLAPTDRPSPTPTASRTPTAPPTLPRTADRMGTSQPTETLTITPTGTPTPTPARLAGTPVVESLGGVPLVYVPAGCFLMGSDDGDPDERPVHRVCLSAFWIGRTEVTNAQYAACVDEGGCLPLADRRYASDPAYADHPAVGVTWEQADAYAAWLSATTGESFRLPTEAQWEYAARGPESRLYPWGETFDGTRLNYCDVNCPSDGRDSAYDDGYARTAPAGRYSPAGDSWVGAADLAGNVWEWTADWYSAGYYASLPDGARDPAGPEAGQMRVLRGGSWYLDRRLCRSADRYGNRPGYWYWSVGFRVARPADS